MIKFAPSGNSISFYEEGYKSTLQVPKWLVEKGLTAFEYSFGRGVRMSEKTAIEIGQAFKAENVEISVHAPYFINFANEDEEKKNNSFEYLKQSLEFLKLMGGKRCVFHAASCGKSSRERAFKITLERLNILSERLQSWGVSKDIILCPETMGKRGQIGTTAEVVEMCKLNENFIPCLDFGHINAFGYGCLKTKNDFARELDIVFDGLGEHKAKNIHIHFSKIQYTKMGEVKHLTFADDKFGPEFDFLAELIYERKMTPYIVCESAGVQAEDAVVMKKIYENQSAK